MADLKSKVFNNNKNNIQSEKKLRAIKILNEEYKDLGTSPIYNIGVTVGLINKDNIFEWRFTLLGPKETSYELGMFFGKIIFSENYPEMRPIISFITPIYHPNVKHLKDNNNFPLGNVSVSFLNGWKRGTKIRKILAKLYTIFYMANPECCYDNNIGKEYKENRGLYELKVKYFTEKYASTFNLKEYDKDWDFTIDEKDPKFIKLKEQLNKDKNDGTNNSNKSIDNNQVNKQIKKTNSPDENENNGIKLTFYFSNDKIEIQCKSNDIIRDVISRVKSRFSWKNISNEIMFIYDCKRITNMDISVEDAGIKNYSSILMIDTHDIMYC